MSLPFQPIRQQSSVSQNSAYSSQPRLSPEDQQLTTEKIDIVEAECRKAYVAG
ncbi:hypothetical protein [Streptomyces chiangmaiensis]|uniref:Uncharacterized protein n=1 Tax=Streptomyces chiangmaiensis TaxID=766497 RepID=A0ABU7FWT9_9ACTN|nr:hypothetical protein [Streptomyces chiangmaiensis]MED7828605.1 hypothetical protein [Streptomyces chiangmaiensis]